MKIKEKFLWQWLRKAKESIKKLELERIENMCSSGMADTNGCFEGREFWIELKTTDRPKTSRGRVRLRFEKSQRPWLRRRWNSGSQAYALIQVGANDEAKRYLIPGNTIFRMDEYEFEEDLEIACIGSPYMSAEKIIELASKYRTVLDEEDIGFVGLGYD